MIRYLSVCSGIEAASVAWEPLGFVPVAFAEIEPFPSAVLAHHWPDTPNLGDMTNYEKWPICACGSPAIARRQDRAEGRRASRISGQDCPACGNPAIDLLVGGTPCQSFSVAGLRQGLSDPRGNLALTFLAMVDRFRPAYVVWENVPGVLSDSGNAFGHFLAGLEELGYEWAYRVLDAQYFGVPQRRRRVFVVGCPRGCGQHPAAVLFEPASLSRDLAPGREAGQSVAALTSCGVGTCGADDNQGQGGAPLIPVQSNQGQAVAFEPRCARNGRGMPEPVCPPLKAESGTTGKGDSAPCVATGYEVRRITPTEAERLQGFPDGHTKISWRGKQPEDCPDGSRYKALGNSMAVPVMRWIGERIQAAAKRDLTTGGDDA